MERDFNQNLKNFFDSQGITQRQIAERLGVSPAYVNKLLGGGKAFGKKTAQQFQDLFGLSASWLLTGEGTMLRPSTSVHHVSGNGIAVGNGNNISNSAPDTSEIIRKIEELTQHIIGLESLQKEQTARLLAIIERLADSK